MGQPSNFRIAKGGRLLVDEWIYDKEARQGHTNIGVDITERAYVYLMESCTLEQGVTLEDILLLVDNSKSYDQLSPLLTRGPWLKEFAEEGLNASSDTEPEIDKIILSWCIYNDKDILTDRDILEQYVHPYGIKDESTDRYGLSFYQLNKIKDCEIILDEKVCITDQRETIADPPIILETHKNFTLFDILHGLFWDFSFHGSPAQRDEVFDGLMESVRKIRSGEETGIPFDELKEKLAK